METGDGVRNRGVLVDQELSARRTLWPHLTVEARGRCSSIKCREGHQQGGKAYRRYVVIALGSVAEAETQIEIAKRLKYVADSDLAIVKDTAGHLRRVLF